MTNEEQLARLRERLTAAQTMAVEVGRMATQLEHETRTAIERIDGWRKLWEEDEDAPDPDQTDLFQQDDG